VEEDTNVNTSIVICPDCKCQVSAHRLEKHRLDHCPKNGKIRLPCPPRLRRIPQGRLITRKTLYSTAGNPPISKCRFCGKPSVPGDDICYSCMG